MHNFGKLLTRDTGNLIVQFFRRAYYLFSSYFDELSVSSESPIDCDKRHGAIVRELKVYFAVAHVNNSLALKSEFLASKVEQIPIGLGVDVVARAVYSVE